MSQCRAKQWKTIYLTKGWEKCFPLKLLQNNKVLQQIKTIISCTNFLIILQYGKQTLIHVATDILFNQ